MQLAWWSFYDSSELLMQVENFTVWLGRPPGLEESQLFQKMEYEEYIPFILS